ncbi:hypothetical protein C8Q77DRAFT_662363 [Trametes polyzona]|nr:hypothetical protein C8Q77DRAFT_662363 [Trametes polyzona]
MRARMTSSTRWTFHRPDLADWHEQWLDDFPQCYRTSASQSETSPTAFVQGVLRGNPYLFGEDQDEPVSSDTVSSDEHRSRDCAAGEWSEEEYQRIADHFANLERDEEPGDQPSPAVEEVRATTPHHLPSTQPIASVEAPSNDHGTEESSAAEAPSSARPVSTDSPTHPEKTTRRESRKRARVDENERPSTSTTARPTKRRRAHPPVPSGGRRAATVEAPVAGPSRHAHALRMEDAEVEDAEAEAMEDDIGAAAPTKKRNELRARRTQQELHKDVDLTLPLVACSTPGCAFLFNPLKFDKNQAHIEHHTGKTRAELKTTKEINCFWHGCDATVAGSHLHEHIAEMHTGMAYLCPVRCGWRSMRAGYQPQHMRKSHS